MSAPRTSHGGAVVQDPTLQLPPVHVTNAWSDENPQPSKGAGWFGLGPPLQVRQNYRVRPFEDGAGICSPGRWTPKKRLLPDVGNVAEDLIAAMGLDMEQWETTTFRIMAGKQPQNPFTPEQINKGSGFLTDWVTRMGHPPSADPQDIPQGPNIRLLQAYLRVCQDPDAEAMDCFATGVELGYGQRMPRTPAIFEAKSKWR